MLFSLFQRRCIWFRFLPSHLVNGSAQTEASHYTPANATESAKPKSRAESLLLILPNLLSCQFKSWACSFFSSPFQSHPWVKPSIAFPPKPISYVILWAAFQGWGPKCPATVFSPQIFVTYGSTQTLTLLSGNNQVQMKKKKLNV